MSSLFSPPHSIPFQLSTYNISPICMCQGNSVKLFPWGERRTVNLEHLSGIAFRNSCHRIILLGRFIWIFVALEWYAQQEKYKFRCDLSTFLNSRVLKYRELITFVLQNRITQKIPQFTEA